MAEVHHVKLSRKALREPDEFQALTAQAAEWLRANQAAVAGALSAVVAVAAIVLGFNWYTGRQTEAAATRFSAAHALFDARKFGEAATEFANLSAEYPRTPSGKLAGLYRAHALARGADPASAATAYSEYLASDPPTPYLRQEALLGLGRSHEAGNDAAAALDAYREAAAIDGPFRTAAQLAEARLEEAAGDADKAKALYGEVVKAPDLDPETREMLTARFPSAAPPAAPPPADVPAE